MPDRKPFREGLGKLSKQAILPVDLTSRQLREVQAAIRGVAFFSARTTSARYLAVEHSRVKALLDGTTDIATARYELKKALQEEGYIPKLGEKGTIKDLSSDVRTELVLRTNLAMSQGYGQRVQGMAPGVVDAFPCQELIRTIDSKEKRNWPERWRDAGGRVYPGSPKAGLPLYPGFQGRCIARKDDEVWWKISAFETPYQPFDFGSGVDVVDISYRESVRLGVIEMGERVQPEVGQFGESMEAEAKGMDEETKKALLPFLKGYKFDGDTLRRAA